MTLGEVLHRFALREQIVAGEKGKRARLACLGHAADGKALTLCGQHGGGVLRVPCGGGEPRLDQQQSARRQVALEALQCLPHAVKGAQVADGAEQAQDDVIGAAEVEGEHVGDGVGPGGVLGRGDMDELGLEVDAVHLVVLCQVFVVLGGAAGHVQQGFGIGALFTQQGEELVSFGFVVLEGVEGVVVLGGLGVHGFHLAGKTGFPNFTCR